MKKITGFTKYGIYFKNNTGLHHTDYYNLKYDDVIGSLLMLNGKSRDDIKHVVVSYDSILTVENSYENTFG